MRALWVSHLIFFLGVAAWASDLQFSAQVDRAQISQDETVSLKFSATSEGAASITVPSFSAPDFEVVNEYTSSSNPSYYVNGRFGMRTILQHVKVLRPLKTGTLKISGIQLQAGGKVYTAPQIEVRVDASGGGTPPPPSSTGGGLALRGSGRQGSVTGFFVRAELDKSKVYKGEQLIVSYYLYARGRVFNLESRKYPTLSGFLREDLEMPILGQSLHSEPVVVNGVPYNRALLVRYAAYPLKDGKLKIDPLSIRASYHKDRADGLDEDPFMNFFRQLTPLVGTSDSEPLMIEVLSLPTEGRPASFTGGVGNFSVTSAVDKYEVKANEAVTLTVKIEGRGNVAAIEEPKAQWPVNTELYDTKGRSKSGQGGVGEKIFEFLLIPRVPGKLSLPALEFSFFDPVKGAYVTESTTPIEINVLEGAPGSAPPPTTPVQPQTGVSATEAKKEVLRPLKSSEDKSSSGVFQGLWRWLVGLSILMMAGMMGLIGWDIFRGWRGRRQGILRDMARKEAKSWQRLRSRAAQAANGASWDEVLQSYELLCGAVYDAIDQKTGVGARSQPRSALKGILVDERGISPEVWERIENILEYSEIVRFALSAGAVTETEARSKLSVWVEEGVKLSSELTRHL